jgi:hypothetical protein
MVISLNRTQEIIQKNYTRNIHLKKFWLKPPVTSINKKFLNQETEGPLNLLQGKAYKTICK